MPQTEPYFTYNLFVNAAIFFGGLILLYFAIARQFQSKDRQAEVLAKVIKERDDKKEEVVKIWRETYVSNQHEIDRKVEKILEALGEKMDKEEHKEGCQAAAIRERLEKHCHDTAGNVIIPR